MNNLTSAEKSPVLVPMPEKIEVFVGPAESGKTRKAKELYDGKNAVWIDGRNKKIFKTPYPYANVTAETEVIIIDDLPLKELTNTIFSLFVNELVINARQKKTFTIPRPKILITCEASADQIKQDNSIRRRANFTFFPEVKTYVPQFNEVRFYGSDSEANFKAWLEEKTAFVIHLKDLRQDMTEIHVHESGEILHCDFHGKIYNGLFVNLANLRPGYYVEIWAPDYQEFCPFTRLIIESVEAKKGGQNG